MDKELRAYSFEIRTDADDKHGNYVTGTPIVFDVATDIGGMFTEVIDRGALDKTDLKDVRFLVNHDTSKIPLARSRNNNANSTMQMSVADNGMNIRVDLDTENNTDAKNLYSAISRGDVSGMSFMFTVDGERWEGLDTDKPVRHITSIQRVFEVSAVTFPAYEQTSIQARGKETLDNAKSALESARAEERKAEEARVAKINDEIIERERTLFLLTH